MMKHTIALSLLAALSAQAAVVTWVGGGATNTWQTAANWSSGAVPTISAGGDDVLIENAEVLYVPGGDWIPYTAITIGANGIWRQISGAAWPNIRGTVTVENGGILDFGTAGQIRVGEGGLIQVRSGGTLIANGPYAPSTGSGGISVENGTVEWSGNLNGTSDNGGAITIGEGGVFRNVFNGTITASPAFTLLEGGSLTFGSETVSTDFRFSGNDRLEGGELITNDEFQFGESLTLNGTRVTCRILSSQSANQILTLQSGSIVCTDTAYDGFYQNSSGLSFPSGSTATLTFAGCTPDQAYSRYFSNGKVLYNGMTVDESLYASRFSVTESATLEGGIDIALLVAEGGISYTLSAPSAGNVDLEVTATGLADDAVATLYYGTTNPGKTTEGWENSMTLTGLSNGTPALYTVNTGSVGILYTAICAVSGDSTVWADVDQSALVTSPSVNTWKGTTTDASLASNWSLGHVPTASEYVFVSSELSGMTLTWPSENMPTEVAGWFQPGFATRPAVSVVFQTPLGAPLTIAGDAVLHSGNWYHDGPAAEPIYAVDLIIGGSLMVNSGVCIQAGMASNQSTLCARGYMRAGPGYTGGGTVEGETGGASYGGEGCSSLCTTVYGSVLNPLDYGSSGFGDDTVDYSGGGLVRLRVAGTLTLNGTIAADGFGYPLWAACKGASSGGTVNIECAALLGAGAISAVGGGAEPSGGGSGSGGRIRIRLSDRAASFDAFTGTITATGEAGSDGVQASSAAGTIALQTATDSDRGGTVIVDNAHYNALGSNGVFYATPMRAPTSTESLVSTDWIARNNARLRLPCDMLVHTLTLADETASLATDGYTLTVSALTVAGSECIPGTYTAEEFPTAILGTGRVLVTAPCTRLILR